MNQADGQRSDGRSKSDRLGAFALIFCTVITVFFGSGFWITRDDIVGLRKYQKDSAASLEEQLQQARVEIDKRLRESGGLSGEVQARLKEVDDLSKTLDEVVARVGESKAQIEAIQAKIDSLSKELSGGGPTQELAKLEAQLAAIEANVSTLRQIEQQVRAVQEQAGTTSVAVRQLQDGFKAALDAKNNPQINPLLGAEAFVEVHGLTWIYEAPEWKEDILRVNIRVSNPTAKPVEVRVERNSGSEMIVLSNAESFSARFEDAVCDTCDKSITIPPNSQRRFVMIATRPIDREEGVSVSAVQVNAIRDDDEGRIVRKLVSISPRK